jgi:hypothetical protein
MQNGGNPKVAQELLRHASLKVHDRRLHAGSRFTQARGTEQSGQTGAEGRGFGNQTGLSGSNWTLKKSDGLAEAFYFVGVPDGI